MSYKIIVDSCCELTEDMKESGHFESVALQIEVGGQTIVDDETFEQQKLLELVKKSSECPKSACPSPEAYRKAFEGEEERAYAVTLSAELSGSYNSAQLGRTMFLEDGTHKQIYVFNSRTASVGETLIAMKIMECEKLQMSFKETIDAVESYIQSMNTIFVLESIDTLRKNGRLSNLKAFIAETLNIKPILGGTKKGTIYQLDQARGMQRALKKMIKNVLDNAAEKKNEIIAIANCNCRERALHIKEELMKSGKFRKIFILDTAGISTLYANDGGIIIVG